MTGTRPVGIGFLTITIIATLFISSPGIAEVRDARELASQMCDSCHARRGVGRGPFFPVLAGQRESYLAKQLRDFRDGRRMDPTMEALAKQLSEEEIDALAAFYASHRDALCF